MEGDDDTSIGRIFQLLADALHHDSGYISYQLGHITTNKAKSEGPSSPSKELSKKAKKGPKSPKKMCVYLGVYC